MSRSPYTTAEDDDRQNELDAAYDDKQVVQLVNAFYGDERITHLVGLRKIAQDYTLSKVTQLHLDFDFDQPDGAA
jgi:hypothetical protein